MGLFTMFSGSNINELAAEAASCEGAVLLDVRSSAEYEQGHIEGAMNIPVGGIDEVVNRVTEKETPVYVYCLSGGRAGSAVSFMRKAGYENVINMGGINSWNGPVVTGKE